VGCCSTAGDWPYDAFRWFTAHAGHGHLVVLRASRTTESQDEFYNGVQGVLSVRTFVFSDRKAASDPAVLAAVKAADGFHCRRDQSNYVRMWRGTSMRSSTRMSRRESRSGDQRGLAVRALGSMAPWTGAASLTRGMADPWATRSRSRVIFSIPNCWCMCLPTAISTRVPALAACSDSLAKTIRSIRSVLWWGWSRRNAAMTVEADGTAHFYAHVPGKRLAGSAG
jgi:beta-aspartyl-peptidase (threonine type)